MVSLSSSPPFDVNCEKICPLEIISVSSDDNTTGLNHLIRVFLSILSVFLINYILHYCVLVIYTAEEEHLSHTYKTLYRFPTNWEKENRSF